MRLLQPSSPSADSQSSVQTQASAQAACLPVTFRPDTQRQSTTLVDLTGDGLIVSAVPNAHVQSVFTHAGYGEVNFSAAARWCITQAATRDLMQPQGQATNQLATRLVQVGQNWQLMSHEQWLAHQAAMKPIAQDTTTAGASAASPAASTSQNAEAAKPSKPRATRPSSVTSLVQRLSNKLNGAIGAAKPPSALTTQK